VGLLVQKTIVSANGLETGDVGAANEPSRVPTIKNPAAKPVGEAMMFIGVIFLSFIAIAVVAMVAPFVLAASALTALLMDRGAARGWRPVAA
jgi:hypothetical protein